MNTKSMSAQHTPKRRLIDHRACGGGGCAGCKQTGVKVVAVLHPVGLSMPADEAAFEVARHSCACYEGISVNEGVAQCRHAEHRRGGEWCQFDDCPAIAKATEST